MSEPLTTVAKFLEACASDDPRRRDEANAMVARALGTRERTLECECHKGLHQWENHPARDYEQWFQHPLPYATAVPGDPDQGNLWWEMWLALPREGEGWYYALRELAPCPDFAFRVRPFQIDGLCPAKNVNFSCGTPPFGDTPNAALAAALLLALDQLKETE